MSVSLKNLAARGMFWTALRGAMSQFFTFSVMIAMARLLTPRDFGLIGMLVIFISISTTIVSSGLGNALVQKNKVCESDYSTVFIFNLFISLLLYVLLYFGSPLISDFYGEPDLVLITRVLSLTIIINAFGVTQSARLSRKMDFKTQAIVSTVSTFISSILALAFALKGYGVWSLVIQQIALSFCNTIGLYIACGFLSNISFSSNSFFELFQFGSKLLLAGILGQLMRDTYTIILGREYSSDVLGHYSRSRRLADLSSGFIAQIFETTTYPLLCTLNDQDARMLAVYRRLIKMAAFAVFPVMTLIAVLAEPIVLILLGDKWLDSVLFLQMLVIARITYPISVLNMNILNAKGRSDLFLKVDLFKIPMVLIILLISIPYGLNAIILGQVLSSWISFFVNAYLPGKMFGYGAMQQVSDMLPYICLSIVMVIIVFVFKLADVNPYSEVFIFGSLGLLIYIALAHLCNLKEIEELKSIVKGFLSKQE